MNIDADVLENLIKLGAVNLLRLKVDSHILNKACKINVLLAELVDRFPVQQNLLAAGKQDLRAIDILQVKLNDSDAKRRRQPGKLRHQFIILLDVYHGKIPFVSPG